MKILVVDDHPLFLSGIRQALADGTDKLDSVAEATSIGAALAAIEKDPDIDWILLDLQLPDGDGFSLLGELSARRLPIPVIVLSARSDPATVDRALRSGASGYLPKSAPTSEILEAMRALERSGHYVARSLRSKLDAYRAGLVNGATAELTRRQQQILELVARGLGNLEIAETLGLSVSTVKGHVATLFALLNADNRTACVHEARRLRLID